MVDTNRLQDNFYVQVVIDLFLTLAFTVYCYLESIYRFFVPPPLKSIAQEIVLITGSASGIGREICLQLASTGATLVCWDIDKTRNESLIKALHDLGVTAHGYDVDVSNRSQVEATAANVRSKVGDVTILINNAGVMPCNEFLNQTPTEMERLFQVNVFSHFWTLREFLPRMLQLNHGHIVTISSTAGLIPVRNLSTYCGTKHAVHGFAEALRDEMRCKPERPKINFTIVYPFTCNTQLINGVKCHTRFPSVLPISEPAAVAHKIVDGFRRNYEHIYIPPLIQLFGTAAKMLLPKVQTAGADFFVCHVEPMAKKCD